jgi:hypothetical protein
VRWFSRAEQTLISGLAWVTAPLLGEMGERYSIQDIESVGVKDLGGGIFETRPVLICLHKGHYGGLVLGFLTDSLIHMAWISKPLNSGKPTSFAGSSEISQLELKQQNLKIVK